MNTPANQAVEAAEREKFHAYMESKWPGIDMSLRSDGTYWENRDDDWEIWKAAASTRPLEGVGVGDAPDCSNGQPCTTCPDKSICGRGGCVRQSELISTAYHTAEKQDQVNLAACGCGGTGEKDGKPCPGLKFDGTPAAEQVEANPGSSHLGKPADPYGY